MCREEYPNDSRDSMQVRVKCQSATSKHGNAARDLKESILRYGKSKRRIVAACKGSREPVNRRRGDYSNAGTRSRESNSLGSGIREE
jgi:hypothetical protein